MSNRFSRLVVITALALVTAPAVATPASGAADVGIRATTFADEFNGPAGSPVDTSKWRVETGNNHEYQYYTTRTQNAAMDGQGNLVITARRENPGDVGAGALAHTSPCDWA